MLVMSLLLGILTKQVNYTAAFIYVDINRDPNWDSMSWSQCKESGNYIQMPKGFQNPGHVLKAKKLLLGPKQSPRNFLLHLKDNLEEGEFKQLGSGPCLFVSYKVVYLVHVDDTLLYWQSIEDVDECINNLQEAGMLLGVEDVTQRDSNEGALDVKMTEQSI
jgi:hypothetical protein